MSDDLIAFLKAWHDWATNGAPEGGPFDRRNGLCPNARSKAVYDELVDIRKAEFADDDWVYPFGEGDYDERYDNATQHECPKRLAWVREKLVEAGELVT